MHEAGSTAATVQEMRTSTWLTANGTAFDWTAADQKEFQAAYKRYVGIKRSAILRIIAWLARILMGSAFVLFLILSIVTIRSMENEQPLSMESGVIIGVTSTFITLAIFGFIAKIFSAKSDIRWSLTKVHVGVKDGLLWQHKRHTLAVYSVDSFIDVTQSSGLILAFVGPTSVNPFPRDKLKTTQSGRLVLNWFASNWPNRVEAV